MTFIAVRCPHCQSDQIVKRGKTARGTQRYLCQNTLCIKGSFLLDYCNRGCLHLLYVSPQLARWHTLTGAMVVESSRLVAH